MTEVLLFSTVIVPIVLGVVELIKRSVSEKLNKNLIPLIAFAVGIFIGFAGEPFTDLDLTLRLWAGALAGLASTGLFEIGNERNEGVE
ncbi:holin [Psychrobacillus psychrodurans]|uniref:holin n=1 Tax=Psychrobacillus psychrodurans TaxID=126157 RepID=UPI0008E4F00F|nr:holin [Psychrobacillus psychrodurans]MCZ8541953.1 holin [Psychrobacillus psychrodurans]SFN14227.1 Bacteriophage A118-like holin, Hol118 [Psychrobacillus psychrodurans]